MLPMSYNPHHVAIGDSRALAPTDAMLREVAELDAQIKGSFPPVFTEVAPGTDSVLLWVFYKNRTFLVQGFPSGFFTVRETLEPDSFTVDDFESVHLEEAVAYLRECLQVPGDLA